MDNTKILNDILAHPQFVNYKKATATSYRDSKEKNPSLDLDENGLYYDHKTGEGGSLLSLAIKLGIYEEKSSDNISEKNKELPDGSFYLQNYLERRDIDCSSELMQHFIKSCDSKWNEGTRKIIIPSKDKDGNVIQIRTYELTDDWIAENKRSFGRSNGVKHGLYVKQEEKSDKLCVFEGLEDAAAFNSMIPKKMDYFITFGANNLKNVLDYVNDYKEVKVILDPDTHNASYNQSLKIGGVPNVVRYYPKLEMDCNEALKQGRFNEWFKSLEEKPFDWESDKFIKDLKNGDINNLRRNIPQ